MLTNSDPAHQWRHQLHAPDSDASDSNTSRCQSTDSQMKRHQKVFILSVAGVVTWIAALLGLVQLPFGHTFQTQVLPVVSSRHNPSDTLLSR